MSIQPTQPQSIGGVLDTTFQLYKASIVKMIPLSLLMAVAESPSSIYLFTQGGTATAANPFAMLNAIGPAFWLVVAVQLLGTTWVMAAAYLKVGAIGAGDDLSVGAALQNTLARVPAIIVMFILLSIALVAGTLLLLVPGIILSVSLALAFTILLFENKGPVDALTESHRLVWGNWWRTATIFTVWFIMLLVLYFVVGLLVGIVTPLLVLGAGADNMLLMSTLSGWVIGLVMSLLVTPFYVALPIAVYWDLKLRKEGGDLAARVGALNPA